MSPEAYLKLPYCRILIPEPDGGYAAEILEFDGCFEFGDTPDETIARLEHMALSWLEACLARGLSIPPPSTYKERHHLKSPATPPEPTPPTS